MTRVRHDNKSTEFGLWLRKQKQIGSHTFSAQNLDYIWHNFIDGWFITIEEKRFGGMQNQSASWSQRDTHRTVEQLLKIASGATINTARGKRPIEYRGHYLVVFKNTNPDDSEWIKINGKTTTTKGLLTLLTTGKTDDEH